MAIFNYDSPAGTFHTPNTPGSIPQQNNIARQAFDGEILIHGAYEDAFGFGHHTVESAFRNGATASNGGQAAAPTSAQPVVDAVIVKINSGTSAPRGDALGEHVNDRVKLCTCQITVGVSAAHAGKQVLHIPVICCARISSGASGTAMESSSLWRMARTSAAHSNNSSRVVAKNLPFGDASRQCPERPILWRATAIDRGEPIWQTRSTVPISIPNSSEAVATSTRNSPALSFFSAASRSLRERLPWCAPTASAPRISPK